jgi:glycosyltransferase involved in cell wall biosynthesis
MRILLISHTCQSRTEGQPKAEWLARMPGIELRVLVPERWRHYGRWRAPEVRSGLAFDLQVGKVRWPWLPGAQFYLHYYPRLRRVIEEFRPDIIDLWEEPWALVSAHACWLRDRVLPSAKIVAETEQNIFKKLPPPFEQFRSFVNRRADFMVGRSPEALAVARQTGYRGQGAIVPNGVDVELFRPRDRVAARAAVLPSVPVGSGFVAGYVGRLVPEKGVMDLVEALPHCAENVHLAFVGSGPFREQLEHRAAALGASARVHFLGARGLEDLPEIMNALDVLVLPSRTTARWKEQFGRVIIEAQACGTPVIGSDSGAIPDVVADGGVIVPEGNPPALAAALRQLEASPHTAAQFGTAGRRKVERECSWQRVAERMEAIYRAVGGLPGAGPRPGLGPDFVG